MNVQQALLWFTVMQYFPDFHDYRIDYHPSRRLHEQYKHSDTISSGGISFDPGIFHLFCGIIEEDG